MFHNPLPQGVSRRAFLQGSSIGVGAAALAMLLEAGVGRAAAPAGAATDPLLASRGAVHPLHHVAKAKRVIFLCMAGGPSHLETLDYRPKLAEWDGRPMPESITAGQPIAQLQGKELVCLGPRAKFARHGQSGQEISDYLPNIARLADDIAIVRSMVTEQINHDPAHTFMNTGTAISGRPSMGAWINYGLGSEADDLPGFVVLTSKAGRNPQPIAQRQWSAGFLPSRYQGVEFSSQGDPVHYVRNPPGVDSRRQQDVVEAVAELDAQSLARWGNPEIATRIAQYELAFRMQTSVPELMDLSDEPAHVLEMYGATPGDGSFASNCLLARRLAERGVRFIHLYNSDWDHHNSLDQYLQVCADVTDRATWALITDLKQRGMLDETLIIWGGEFGRTPMAQSNKGKVGRDHHIKGFSMFLCGGGIRGGVIYGSTDDFGYHAAENPVHVRDLHATMLHLLGINHQRFSVRFQGLDTRLTGVEPARPVRAILA